MQDSLKFHLVKITIFIFYSLPLFIVSYFGVFLIPILIFYLITIGYLFLIRYIIRKNQMKKLAKELNCQYFPKNVRGLSSFLNVLKIKNILINKEKNILIFDVIGMDLLVHSYILDSYNFYTVINGTVYYKYNYFRDLLLKPSDIKEILKGNVDKYVKYRNFSFGEDLGYLEKFLTSDTIMRSWDRKPTKDVTPEEEKNIFSDFKESQKPWQKISLIVALVIIIAYILIAVIYKKNPSEFFY